MGSAFKDYGYQILVYSMSQVYSRRSIHGGMQHQPVIPTQKDKQFSLKQAFFFFLLF